MSANKENEETLRQLESRLQKLESQRIWAEYEQEEKKRTARKFNAYANIFGAIGMGIFFGIGCIVSNVFDNLDGTGLLTMLILGIFLLAMFIAGLRQLDE